MWLRNRLRFLRKWFESFAACFREWRLRCDLLRHGCQLDGVVLHDGWKLPTIQSKGKILFGSKCQLRCVDVAINLWVAENASISLGEHSYINQGVTIAAKDKVEIGPDCRIGEYVAIHDNSFHPVCPDEAVQVSPVLIGRNVWIGHGAIIFAGAHIGDLWVIGAGAIVTGIIPEKCVAVGVPAKVIRAFDCPDNWKRP